MNSKHKKTTVFAATVMAVILLAACGTRDATPSEVETSSHPQASTFYCYDAKQGIWQPLGDEASAGTLVYVDAATDAVTADLMKQLSYTREEAQALLAEGGLEIYLCMDPSLQATVDAACTEQSKQGKASESGQPLQSAVVLLENTTGKVLALSSGDYDEKKPNPVTQALYMPGSAFAPLSVYAPALELGKLTPDSVVRDQPMENGWPVNPSGSFHDAITVQEALCAASNCVPVGILDQYFSLEESAQFVQERFFIELVLDRDEDGRTFTDLGLPALALGGLTDGVTPLDMAAAYSVFPRGGAYATPALYEKVVDKDGKELLSGDTATTPVLKEDTASAMTAMLREVVANGVGTEAKLEGQNAAGMPGVTPSKKDIWFVGYNSDYTTAVWSGYNSKEAISASGNPSAVLWKQVMQAASEGA